MYLKPKQRAEDVDIFSRQNLYKQLIYKTLNYYPNSVYRLQLENFEKIEDISNPAKIPPVTGAGHQKPTLIFCG